MILTREKRFRLMEHANTLIELKDYDVTITYQGVPWWVGGFNLHDGDVHLVLVENDDREVDIELTDDELLLMTAEILSQVPLNVYQASSTTRDDEELGKALTDALTTIEVAVEWSEEARH